MFSYKNAGWLAGMHQTTWIVARMYGLGWCTRLCDFSAQPKNAAEESGEVIGGEYDDPHTPQVRKVWAGWKKECCSTADTFTIVFPKNLGS